MQIRPSDETDRVRRHTPTRSLQCIDQITRANVRRFASEPPEMLDERIAQLERKWDMERTLEMNASVLALTGAVLGATVDKKWFLLTGTVLGFLAQHATMGWCPPVPVFRRLGVRTQGEIDEEKFALKALRGDFRNVGSGSVEEVMEAVAR
jgi:hypothetical protein